MKRILYAIKMGFKIINGAIMDDKKANPIVDYIEIYKEIFNNAKAYHYDFTLKELLYFVRLVVHIEIDEGDLNDEKIIAQLFDDTLQFEKFLPQVAIHHLAMHLLIEKNPKLKKIYEEKEKIKNDLIDPENPPEFLKAEATRKFFKRDIDYELDDNLRDTMVKLSNYFT